MTSKIWIPVVALLIPSALRAQEGPPDRGERGRHRMEERHKRMEERLKKLPPEKQEKIRKRMEEFKNLPPEERRKKIEQCRRLRKLPPHVRQALRHALKDVPESERPQVMKNFKETAQYLRKNDLQPGLPKKAFGAWLCKNHPEFFRQTDPAGPGARLGGYVPEFETSVRNRIRKHAGECGCIKAGEMDALQGEAFWKAVKEKAKACPKWREHKKKEGTAPEKN